MPFAAAWQVTDTTGSHNKFYRAFVSQSRVVFQYGRIGTVQSTQEVNCASPTAAIVAAMRKMGEKSNSRSSSYRDDGPVVRVCVAQAAWEDPLVNGTVLAESYSSARHRNQLLVGSLSDGQAHVVALLGTGRTAPSTRIASRARLVHTHASSDVTLAVLGPKEAASADRLVVPRVALLDLGTAEPADGVEVFSTAFKLWTPGSSGPQANLDVCLTNARMIHG